MIKKLFSLLAIAILCAVGGYFYVQSQVEDYLSQRLQIEQSEIITIPNGTSLNRALVILAEKHWITPSSYSGLVHRFHSELSNLKAGTYQLQPEISLEQALHVFIEGKEHQFAITFVEGSRFSEWLAILASNTNLKQTLTGLSEVDIADKLGIERKKLEGLFLAETYHFTHGASDLDILKRANKKLDAVLSEEWENKQSGLPLKSAYEALILASIIEKETAVEDERTQIASVFVNRLNRKMRLQTDPTVIYGMGEDYDGNIRKKDLRTPTPYNTYVIPGLPPTPIAMAGPASIHAALNPDSSKYLYFVASGTGGHVFSKTLTEHNRAVRAYLKTIRNK